MAFGEDDGATADLRDGLKPLGVRESSKQRTRAVIVAESLSLFQKRGYDAVTTQEIADQVGVTQRTLFRYFERKDMILFDTAYDYVRRFETYLDAAMLSHSDSYNAVQAAFRELAAYYDHNREVISRIYEIVQQSEQLTALERVHQVRIDWLVACAIDGRATYEARVSQPTLSARIAAAVLFGAIRPMFRAWLKGELQGPLAPYAEAGWANIRPTFDAAVLYAETITGQFAKLDRGV